MITLVIIVVADVVMGPLFLLTGVERTWLQGEAAMVVVGHDGGERPLLKHRVNALRYSTISFSFALFSCRWHWAVRMTRTAGSVLAGWARQCL